MTVIEDGDPGRNDYNEVLRGGIAISAATHADRGTLGAIVISTESGRPLILTNRHVVYGEAEEAQVAQNLGLMVSRGVGHRPWYTAEFLTAIAGTGRPIFQPPYMGGMNRHARPVAWVRRVSKSLDAAVAELFPDVEHSLDVIGPPSRPEFQITGIGEPRKGMIVMKSGALTGITYGRIRGVAGADVIIDYHSDLPWWPEGPVADHGDSGSVWVDPESLRAVALLTGGRYIRGTHNYSTALHMGVVAEKLGFRFR